MHSCSDRIRRGLGGRTGDARRPLTRKVARLGRYFWLGPAVLALVGLLLAARAGRSSRAAGAPPVPAAEPEPPPVAIETPAAQEVPPERSVRGIVRDGLGAVAGAAVAAADHFDGARLAEAHTGADGTFVLGPIEDGAVSVIAEHPERGVAIGDGHPGDFLELWLLPGATLTGTVRAREGGQPLPGARVHAFARAAMTDGDGRYSLGNLHAQVMEAIAVADGYRQARRSFSIAPGGTRTLDFLLERGEKLAGRVTDVRTGTPIAGAEVSERADPHGRSRIGVDRRVLTDAEGHYSLEGVAAERNRAFSCIASGYVAAQRESDGSGRLDFALERPLMADGQVVDPDGRPVPEATVYLHRVAEEGGSLFLGKEPQRTRTDGNGRFSFEGVVPGAIAFVAIAKGYAPGETAVLDARRLPEVVVRLIQGMAMDVSVRDAEGLGVAGASVNTGMPAGLGDRFGPLYGWRERRSLRTDVQGRARIDGLVPGDYAVSAAQAQRGSAYAKVSGNAGETVPAVLTFGGLEIAGRVVTAHGEPAAGAWVSAFGHAPAHIDALGCFRVPGLPQGSFRVQARRGRAASDVVEVAAGTQGVELRLASQILRGAVRSAGGGPLGTFSVSAIWKQPRVNMGFQVEGGDGRFEEPVPPGTYDVAVRAPGHRPSVLRGVAVQAGFDPAPMDFILEPAATLRGTARGRDGRPLSYVWVTATPTKPGDGVHAGNDRTDQEGRYAIDGVGPGAYAVVLNGGHAGTSRALMTIPATGEVTLDLRIGPTGTAVVRVVDEAGKPVPRAYVTFAYAEHDGLAGEGGLTDDEGAWTAGPVPAEVPLVARAQLEDRRAEARISVSPGAKAEARIVLPGK